MRSLGGQPSAWRSKRRLIMERMRKGSLEVIMMMMMRRRRSRRGSITREVKMIVLPDHDHDRSGSIERVLINTSITTYVHLDNSKYL